LKNRILYYIDIIYYKIDITTRHIRSCVVRARVEINDFPAEFFMPHKLPARSVLSHSVQEHYRFYTFVKMILRYKAWKANRNVNSKAFFVHVCVCTYILCVYTWKKKIYIYMCAYTHTHTHTLSLSLSLSLSHPMQMYICTC